jgi:hypothetical protein
MAKADREEWARRVQRWQESGLTAREFATEMGLKATTLTYWKWRLKTDSTSLDCKPAARSKLARRNVTRSMQFVELNSLTTSIASRDQSSSSSPHVRFAFRTSLMTSRFEACLLSFGSARDPEQRANLRLQRAALLATVLRSARIRSTRAARRGLAKWRSLLLHEQAEQPPEGSLFDRNGFCILYN